MYGRAMGMTVVGVGGRPVTVEAFVGRGLPSLIVTGLPGATVQDARERIRPAVEHAGLEWPLRRVVVNLAPGNLRKEGAGLDLPIAVSVLAATAQIPSNRLTGVVLAGELSLRGEVLSTPGVLSVVIAAVRARYRTVVVPEANAVEAAQVGGIDVVPVSTLERAVAYLRGSWRPAEMPGSSAEGWQAPDADLADVRGQLQARRALEVAAAGGHNLLFVGSPGAGKTMLARRLASILPELTRDEALEASQLHSVAGLLAGRGLLRERPFRSPHHTISTAGLLGGGSTVLRPGEASLAHRGVLFLDELTEFRRDAIEALRQPLEDGVVVIARAGGSVAFPARFTMVAAANPCPCGFRGDPVRGCACREDQLARYQAKLSGPLLDRIDLRLSVPRLTKHELLGADAGEPSAAVRARVVAARERQLDRYASIGIMCNAHLPGPIVRRQAGLTAAAERYLGAAVERAALSGRGFDRVLRVARTIADLAGSHRVDAEHVSEALSYREALDQIGRVQSAS
ncbi:MAG TPA: YifB family Mg chelatase-like AAA ATPase [Actinomycetota bacterium]|jgi:magnesium chelatase family protein|nr:YifB family Mg chelatase-like AAA ATPase [Actinomycetota bacterium]